MGSTFVTKQKASTGINRLFGSSESRDVFIQFVTGIVTHVITSVESLTYDGKERKINSILAKSHMGKKIKSAALTDESNRYYPLLRGMVDVPVKGDPVILCTLGGVQYYLGPLNTANNPNFNIDHLNRAEKNLSRANSGESKMSSREDDLGISRNFKVMPHLNRLQKLYNIDLDDPIGEDKIVNEIHGDLVLEGRHGNSIRIGSRFVNPYIMISNGRNPENIAESSKDSAILAMFSEGSIRQHFNNDAKIEDDTIVDDLWILPSDAVEENKRLMSTLVESVNPEVDTEKKIYAYGDVDDDLSVQKSQLFQSSDRVTINARTESLFLSAFQNMHIGTGNSLTISTNKELLIESENIYLGQQSKDTDDKQGIIIGENLREILEELTDLLSRLNGHCQGAPTPLGIDNGPPGTAKSTLLQFIKKVQKESNDFVSNKHFIEEN